MKKLNELLNENEQALPIEGYPNYVVTNHGRIISLNYHHTGEPKILIPGTDTCGYQFVSLCMNGKPKKFKVHRLVATAFIPNHENLAEVNHKDEVKTNNHVDNLEWCDRQYNINYGSRNLKVAEAESKPVAQYTKSGELVKVWSSIHEAEHNRGFNNGAIINCCKGRRYSHAGYCWRYC